MDCRSIAQWGRKMTDRPGAPIATLKRNEPRFAKAKDNWIGNTAARAYLAENQPWNHTSAFGICIFIWAQLFFSGLEKKRHKSPINCLGEGGFSRTFSLSPFNNIIAWNGILTTDDDRSIAGHYCFYYGPPFFRELFFWYFCSFFVRQKSCENGHFR